MNNTIDKYKTIVPNVYQFKNKMELIEIMSLLDENLTKESVNKQVNKMLFNKHKFGLVYHCCEDYTDTPFFKIITGVDSIKKKTPIDESVDKLLSYYSENEISNMLTNCRQVAKKLENYHTIEVIRENTISDNNLDTSAGLCKMLAEHSTQNNRPYSWILIESCQTSWEHYSGEFYDPVPNNSDCGKWEGENLELRKSLLDHSIYCLTLASDTYRL